jgi:hypothetical protein
MLRWWRASAHVLCGVLHQRRGPTGHAQGGGDWEALAGRWWRGDVGVMRAVALAQVPGCALMARGEVPPVGRRWGGDGGVHEGPVGVLPCALCRALPGGAWVHVAPREQVRGGALRV